MISPQDMNVIQIEVTNACVHRCSNCTRFCGHHKKPFFMDVETFKKAVDSLDGFGQMVGVMGGEPTLHPHFEEMVSYYASKIKENRPFHPYLKPDHSFVYYRNHYLSDPVHKRGLWTSLGRQYYKHFELIQDTFPFQCINDHLNAGLHQALLITRKELGIPDDEWYPMRDQCWVQNLWSASITPKGAFFCEIAASLDMLFDGPGGWPIEPGWWKRTPADFGDQLQWCELCSAALPVPRVQANRETDIISPVLLKKLEEVGSPKLNDGKFIRFDPAGYNTAEYKRNLGDPEWYLPAGNSNTRIQSTNDSILPRSINVYLLNKSASIPATCQILTDESFTTKDFSGWCVVTRRPLQQDFFDAMESTVLNPGCLHYYAQTIAPGTCLSPKELAEKADVLVFHKDASAIANLGELRISESLFRNWSEEKQIALYDFPRFVAPKSPIKSMVDYLRGTPFGRHISTLKSMLLKRKRRRV